MKVIYLQLILYLATYRILKLVKAVIRERARVGEARRNLVFRCPKSKREDGRLLLLRQKSQRSGKICSKCLASKFGKASNIRRADPSFRTLHKFLGGTGEVADLRSLDLSNVSSFRRDVYKLLCKIPRGRVTTYGAIARRLGGKRYSRAVGTAVG